MQRVRRTAALLLCLLFASLSLAAQAETVYVTKTGAKYHRASCSSLRFSKIAMSLPEAAAKYQPCKICHPPVPSASSAVASSVAESPKTQSPSRAAESARCQAITKKGTQCLRNAKPGSRYCWQHGG